MLDQDFRGAGKPFGYLFALVRLDQVSEDASNSMEGKTRDGQGSGSGGSGEPDPGNMSPISPFLIRPVPFLLIELFEGFPLSPPF
jgi:hypothetical protein